ncbi:inositol monophosphatase family protein [Tumidithrix elongata RA019]|uniref:3'(2'),5-bisphosphonucleoside 3'(2')-phosphohydrolase n=1 Tax=Tumidithrix elongata BACA0141 TaxID=2716417 RepID=A0AAW9Q131_9CYAN|nr:inositol monophosphatase family protein [Tumidithrix elongata RA019]
MNSKVNSELDLKLGSELSSSQNAEILKFVREAGQKAVQLRTEGFQVDDKGIDDRVTNVDRILDGLLTQQFQQWFPNDIVISEENSLSQKQWLQNDYQQDQARLWFIDPIDGTEDFIHGQENYAVMIGLLKAHQPIMGWVYAPVGDRFYFGGSAIDGLFSNLNDNLNISTDANRENSTFKPLIPQTHLPDSCQVILSSKDEYAYGAAIRSAIPQAEFYSLGSFGLKVMEVVLGRASLYIYLNRRVKLWDTVGPLAIAKAAGLVCCDLEGREIGFGMDAIDPDTLIHHQVILVGWSDFLDRFRPKIAEALWGLL